MRCDACGAGDSLFVMVSGISRTETRLCRACAIEQGYLADDGESTLPQLDFILGQTDAPGDAGDSCPDCGMGSEELVGSGRLGCPGCIQYFRRPYLLSRKRRGLAVGYAGKVPRDFAGLASGQGAVPVKGTLESSRLLADIESAVLAEDFEKAAFLRDRLGTVSTGSSNNCGCSSNSSNSNSNGNSGNGA
jgi:protein-arginine kinase activator protein McsA